MSNLKSERIFKTSASHYSISVRSLAGIFFIDDSYNAFQQTSAFRLIKAELTSSKRYVFSTSFWEIYYNANSYFSLIYFNSKRISLFKAIEFAYFTSFVLYSLFPYPNLSPCNFGFCNKCHKRIYVILFLLIYFCNSVFASHKASSNSRRRFSSLLRYV